MELLGIVLVRTVLVFLNPLEDAEATLPLDEAARLSRRHRPVELPALLKEAKALTPIENVKTPSLLEVREGAMASKARMLLEEAKGHTAGE